LSTVTPPALPQEVIEIYWNPKSLQKNFPKKRKIP